MKSSFEEKRIISNLASIREKPIIQVMVPKNEMAAIPFDMKLGQFIEFFKQKLFSRYPVFINNIDQITGILYIKDIIAFWNAHSSRPVVEFVRLPHFIYEHRLTLEVFVEFQSLNVSFGIVLDEFGAVAGLVTIEDLLGEIVGDIRDEFSAEKKPLIEKKSDKESIVYARIGLDDFAREFSISLHEKDVATLAGLIIKCADHIPLVGEEIIYKNLKFTVLAGTKRKINKVRVERL